MTSSSNYLSLTSKHVDSLIDYVLDVKPYHTKLLQVSEEYTFNDNVNVVVSDEHSFVIFMGADIVDPSSYLSSERPSSKSWLNSFVSNGTRKRFQTPLVAHPKFMSHLGSENFVCGVNDDQQIPGLTLGAFNQVRWDGPGITKVTKNDVQQQEGVNFFISHGVYSFDILSNRMWKRMDIDVSELSNVENSSGWLVYRDVDRYYGSITGIYVDPSLSEYEEWTLTCTYADSITATLEVAGSVSGVIGNAAFDTTFSDPKIQFTFEAALDDLPGTMPPISVGDIFVLTPHNKITIHPDAPEETWSFIKVNPICVSAITVSSGNLGAIEVFTRGAAFTSASNWTVEFINPTQFEVQCPSLAGYPVTVNIIDGTSYKDDNIHFALIAPSAGFVAGDKFDFSISADKPVYKVFGSVTGWTADAELDTWYWNGKIGFKIPSLDHFPVIYGAGWLVYRDVDTYYGSITGIYVDPSLLKYEEYEEWTLTCTYVDSVTATLEVSGSISGIIGYAAFDTTFTDAKLEFIFEAANGDLPGTVPPISVGDTFVLTPQLDTPLFYSTSLAQCQKMTDVHPMAEASVYEITFVEQDATYKYATVRNNKLGSLRGLKLPIGGEETWTDEFVSFKISDVPTAFNIGDVVALYIAPKSSRTLYGGYDDFPYEYVPYDSDLATITYPRNLLEDYFPLFHSHGTVIFPSIAADDEIVIDKAIFETLQLKVAGASTNAMLAAEDNDWVPLEFRYSDTAFSNLTVSVDAYLASDPTYKVLTLSQPRYLNSNISASSTLEFTTQFVQDYLPLGTAVSIRALQYNPTGDQIRVKITESIQFVLTDIIDDNADNSMNFGIYGELDGVANANENLPTGPIVIQIDEKYNQLNNPSIL